MKRLVMAVVFGLTAALALPGLCAGYTAKSYVQDGLVGLWDAEENAGWGVHEAEPVVWKNLVGGVVPDFMLDGAGTFEDKAFAKTSAGLMAHNNLEVSTNYYFKTIEVVISDVPVAVSPDGSTRLGESAVALWGYFENHIIVYDYFDASAGATNRNVTTSYYVQHGLKTKNCPKVASISVTYDDEYSSYFKKHIVKALDAAQGGDNATQVNSGAFNNLTGSLGVGGIPGDSHCRSATGYRIHSIRLYNRQLTSEERSANLIVDNDRFGAALYALGDVTWTGAAGDGKFSTDGNWSGGRHVVPGVPYGAINLMGHGTETMVNDVGVVTAATLRVSQATDATASVTVKGQPFVLTSGTTRWHSSDKTQYALYAQCPMTFDADLTLSDTGYSEMLAYGATTFAKPVAILAKGTVFCKNLLGGKSGAPVLTTFNDTVTAAAASIRCDGSYDNYHFFKPLVAKKIQPEGSIDYMCFHATGNSWTAEVAIYGGIVADTANALPSDLVFAWAANAGADYGDDGTHCYKLRADQTCDRIQSDPVIGKKGGKGDSFIRWRNRIHSDTKDVTLTLKGTADATSYGALVSENDKKLNLVWDPTGNYTQTIGGLAHTMIGEIVVKGGTFASAGTNTFQYVTALRIADGAKFAVTSCDYGVATNPFPGSTDLWLSGAGKVEVAAGVTVTFNNAFAKGVLMPVGVYQSTDGGHATAKKVDWVTGDGLVNVLSCDGTSWKSADKSGNWNDTDNWSNGVPDGNKTTYLSAEGANYTVTMATGDVWPLNLVIRGENATLAVASSARVEFDGTSKTASVSVEEGGTLRVDGRLTLTNYVGTFKVGSTVSATSRVAVVAGGWFCYAPRLQSNNPLVLNQRGALDIGGVVTMPGEHSDMIKMVGGLLQASGDGVFLYGGKGNGQSFWLPTRFESGEMVFAGNATFTNFPGAAQNVTFGSSTAGDSLYVAFRDAARYDLCIDGLNVGNANSHAVVDFDSSVNHRLLGFRVGVRATGEGTAEVRLSKGRIADEGRGFDVGYDAGKSDVAHGRFVQSGGFLYNNASNGAWTDHGMPNGFNVGFGATAPVSSGTVAYGEAFLSGGTNQNCAGVTLVGAGYGHGAVVQTGGEYWHDSAGNDDYKQVFGVGSAGGSGSWTVSNGTLVVKKTDVYVGGFYTNLLTRAERMTRWPDTRHDADGTFTAAGGTVDFQAGLVLGADGRGTVNVVGSAGSFTVGGDLVFSNHVENAQSGGTLNFVLGEKGIKTLNVAGKAVFLPGAKMTVDASKYTESGSALLLWAEGGLVNPIEIQDIELKGASGPIILKRSANGYRLYAIRGLMLKVR